MFYSAFVCLSVCMSFCLSFCSTVSNFGGEAIGERPTRRSNSCVIPLINVFWQDLNLRQTSQREAFCDTWKALKPTRFWPGPSSHTPLWELTTLPLYLLVGWGGRSLVVPTPLRRREPPFRPNSRPQQCFLDPHLSSFTWQLPIGSLWQFCQSCNFGQGRTS